MKETLRRLLVKETGCALQYRFGPGTGWPCNSCFHAIDLPLQHDIHEYWLAVLAERGDYPDEPKNPARIHELMEGLSTSYPQKGVVET